MALNNTDGPWCYEARDPSACVACKAKLCTCGSARESKHEGLRTPAAPLRLYCYEAPFRTVDSGASTAHDGYSISQHGWNKDEERAFGFLSDLGPHYGGSRAVARSGSRELRGYYGNVTTDRANYGAECWAGKTTKLGFCPRVQAVPVKGEQRAPGTSPFVEAKPFATEIVSLKRALELLNEERAVAKLPPLTEGVKRSMIQIAYDVCDGARAKVLVAALPSDANGRLKRLDDIKYRKACLLFALPARCREALYYVGVLRSFWQTLIEKAASEGKPREKKRYQAMADKFAYRVPYPDGSEEPICVEFSEEGMAAAALAYSILPKY